MAKIIELILTEECRGGGTPESIYRVVQQLFTKEGYLIAEYDPCGVRSANNEYSPASLCRAIPANLS
jgi:hypothetical protein